MRVDLSRSNIDMPEHFLYAAQIRPSLEQVGGKAVPQGMGR